MTVLSVQKHRDKLQSDVDRVERFRLTLTFLTSFRRRRNIYFFNSDFKFFDDASEFSVTSLLSMLFLFSLKSSC